jgi:hypothetical protein
MASCPKAATANRKKISGTRIGELLWSKRMPKGAYFAIFQKGVETHRADIDRIGELLHPAETLTAVQVSISTTGAVCDRTLQASQAVSSLCRT